jgi:ABC-type antimicrobial peptide transport system permease subunit
MPIRIDWIVPDTGVGRFSLEATQQTPLNLFVSLERLSQALGQAGRCNALFMGRVQSADPDRALRDEFTLDDWGLSLVGDKPHEVAWLESRRLTLDDAIVSAATSAATRLAPGSRVTPVLAGLATEIRKGSALVPYSVVASVEAASPFEIPPGGALINQWTADRLQAQVGDKITIEFFRVRQDGKLGIDSTEFTVARIIPIEGIYHDRHFAPTYPGVTDADDFRNWKAPFDIDNRKIKKADDDYWHRYRTTPKVFIRRDDGKKIFGGRLGNVSSLRIEFQGDEASRKKQLADFQAQLPRVMNPAEAAFVVQPIRTQQLEASSGSTPFDVLFLSFSFFIILSAGMIVALMFRLNVERRSAHAGLLLATGMSPRLTRGLFLWEGLVLAVVGSALGMFGAIGYASLMIDGLTGRWSDAIQTPFLTFHATATSMAIGFFVSTLLAMAAIWWSLTRISTVRIPSLLARGFAFDRPVSSRSPVRFFSVAALLGLVGFALVIFSPHDNVGAFFGAGAALLVGSLTAFAGWLSLQSSKPVRGAGVLAMIRLGVRHVRRQRTRSILTACLIAFATFIVAAVSAFQHRDEHRPPKKESGDGGFALLAESASSVFSPVSASHQNDLNLTDETARLLAKCDGHAFRVRPGDEASCLNIYQPRNPTLLGVDRRFRERGGFAFAGLASDMTPAERDNPWRLLERDLGTDTLPVIGDAETLQYILKVGVGGHLVIPNEAGRPIKLQVVASLSGSIFQGQLITNERRLLQQFPSVAGFRYFLFDTGSLGTEEIKALRERLELDLTDFGFEVQSTGERLAAYHSVANTYIATFQSLGGLGLLLGTLGLAAVILRNVLERRGELALMRAVGFSPRSIGSMIVAENSTLLLVGIMTGTACAIVAVAPHWLKRSEPGEYSNLAGLLISVLLVGLFVGLLGAWTANREKIVPALRSE